MWEYLSIESEYGGFVCWINNKIIDRNKRNAMFAVALSERFTVARPFGSCRANWWWICELSTLVGHPNFWAPVGPSFKAHTEFFIDLGLLKELHNICSSKFQWVIPALQTFFFEIWCWNKRSHLHSPNKPTHVYHHLGSHLDIYSFLYFYNNIRKILSVLRNLLAS